MRKAICAAAVAATLVAPLLAKAEGAMEIVGWKEKAKIPELGIELTTKNDTGASSASLHAENVEPFEKDDEDWVRFDVVVQERDDEEGEERKTVRWEAPVADTVMIKQKGEPSEKRYMVVLNICMGHINRRVEVNLADRAGFSTRMLLGREFLREAALVDSERTFAREPVCPGPVVDAVED